MEGCYMYSSEPLLSLSLWLKQAMEQATQALRDAMEQENIEQLSTAISLAEDKDVAHELLTNARNQLQALTEKRQHTQVTAPFERRHNQRICVYICRDMRVDHNVCSMIRTRVLHVWESIFGLFSVCTKVVSVP